MATWQIDIEKQLGTEFWTNVYHVDAASQADAISAANLIIQQERLMHNVVITVTKFRVSTFPGPSEGTVIAVNLPCEGGSGEYLPLFNVIRVDFAVAIGRPSRKYYRSGIVESEQANGKLTDATRDSYQDVMDDLMGFAGVNLVDVDGQPLTSASVFAYVGMRQLRRGSKRRATPVIP